jgi:hypothetical protein
MEKYNGWTNKATWLVPLWIDNVSELGFLGFYPEDIVEDSREEWICSAASKLEDHFNDYVAEQISEAGLIYDLLRIATHEINWYEIAEHYAEQFYEETNNA